jgi:hypothetical protein
MIMDTTALTENNAKKLNRNPKSNEEVLGALWGWLVVVSLSIWGAIVRSDMACYRANNYYVRKHCLSTQGVGWIWERTVKIGRHVSGALASSAE